MKDYLGNEYIPSLVDHDRKMGNAPFHHGGNGHGVPAVPTKPCTTCGMKIARKPIMVGIECQPDGTEYEIRGEA